MLNKYIHIFSVSLVVTILVGVATYRFLPSWQLLISDVGNEGAWTISILFHLIYGSCIGLGNIGSYLFQKISTAPFKLVSVASLITIVLLNTLISVFSPVFESMLLFCLLLTLSAFVICSILFVASKRHNKSSKPTTKNVSA